MEIQNNMYISVDVETDGPYPSVNDGYSMVSFGAIVIDEKLDKTFYGKLKPISKLWNPKALSISGFSREETLIFEEPQKVMEDFEKWIIRNKKNNTRPMFLADNNGFDWMFINYYFHRFLGRNPFGYSSQNINSLYKGLVKDMSKNFAYLRKTFHSHNPVDDARGNAEAFLEMRKMGLKI